MKNAFAQVTKGQRRERRCRNKQMSPDKAFPSKISASEAEVTAKNLELAKALVSPSKSRVIVQRCDGLCETETYDHELIVISCL